MAEKYFNPDRKVKLHTYNKADLFISILLILFSFVISLFFIRVYMNKPFWHDEAYSFLIAAKSFSDIIKALIPDSGAPLYYFLLHIWLKIFGITETAVRSLGIFLSFFGVAAVYVLSYKILNRKIFAFIVALLFSVSQLNVAQAATARMYPLFSLLCILSSILFIEIFINNNKNKFNSVAFVAAGILGFLTHYWYVLFFISQFVYLLFFNTKQIFSKTFLFPPFLFAVLWGYFFYKQFGNAALAWLTFSEEVLIWTYNYAFYERTSKLYFFGAISVITFIGISFIKKQNVIIYAKNSILESLCNKKLIYMFINFIMVLMLAYVISKFKPIYCADRQPIILLPSFLIISIYFIYKFSNKILLLALISIFVLRLSIRPYEMKTADFKNEEIKCRVVSYNYKNNDIIIIPGLQRSVFLYYSEKNGINKDVKVFSVPAEIEQHPGWQTPPGKDGIDKIVIPETRKILDGYKKDLRKNNARLIFFTLGRDELTNAVFNEISKQMKIYKRIHFNDGDMIIFY
ncbi:MAG TPA: glycosyltransferase family 39 protein [Candidatus Goldiibacteriota bacterium]|nr:glycosyltransferase family 39 protein [Candidatus Goldiibacteriota bacterium]HPN63840.1 glycosyltransferase family 39 protein [Candidatus Goldiibacteriota bacterium]HRQ43042.1 glycosyltransferase family 39 protein [Candidatus Goldiibacteriota bacterium]